MNILLANTPEECARWKGIVVIVDVLRTVSTVCVLLKRESSRAALLCASVQTAELLKKSKPGLVVLSEREMPFEHQDDSPYLASKLSSGKSVLVVSKDSGRAFQGATQASRILMGSFCNFEALTDVLFKEKQDVLLVPASIFSHMRAEEDLLCAGAIKDFMQGNGSPERALGEFGNTVRLAEFTKKGPKTAGKDLRFILKIDGLPIVPELVRSEDGEWAQCVPYGKATDEKWLAAPEKQVPQANTAQPAAAKPAFGEPAEPETLPPLSVHQDTQTPPQAPAEPAPAEPPARKAPAQPSAPAKPPKRVAKSSGKKAVPEAENNKAGKTTFRLKGFFSDIVRSVKEEKEELENSLRQAALGKKRAYNLKSQDPMDVLLNKSGQSSATPRVEGHAFAGKSKATAPASTPAGQPVSVGGSGRRKKAIVLFSGGLDSTTCLYWAIAQGYHCEALTVLYGQRHARELESAREITNHMGIPHHIVELNLPWLKKSSLVDASQPLPDIAVEKIPSNGIPSTYVPGRNLMFLSMAGSLADSIGAGAIISGPNAVDFSGYPDCTPAFYQAMGDALNRGTERGVNGGIEVLAPLMTKSKAEIIKMAVRLHAPLELTWSCYAGGEKPCGKCDSCKLRAKGFAEAGLKDPALE